MLHIWAVWERAIFNSFLSLLDFPSSLSLFLFVDTVYLGMYVFSVGVDHGDDDNDGSTV